MRRIRTVVLAGMAALGCQRSPTEATLDVRRPVPEGARSGPWVAKFGPEVVTEAELRQRLAEMSPAVRARFQAVEQRRDFVEGVVRFELLTREAVRQGLANDPEVVDGARRAMVNALLRRELEEKSAAVSDEQARAYYQAHLADYVKPQMTRLTHIAFAKDHRQQALRALERAKALKPLDLAGFGALAREVTEDDATRALDGDLRFRSDDELATLFGAEGLAAIQRLEGVGDLAPELLEGPRFLHVVKLQTRQRALEQSFEQAKASVVRTVLNQTRQARLRALLDRLMREADLQVDESRLAAVTVDAAAPAVDTKGPQPGYFPAPEPGPQPR